MNTKEKILNINPIKKITISAIIMSLYICIMYFTQGFAFGQYQIRIATSLYALNYIYPFLIIPLGIANLLSNTLMGGMGIFDIAGGLAVGIITGLLVYSVRKFNLNRWLITFPLIFGPGLIVPIWLSYIIHVPYELLALSLCIGQILPGIAGVILIKSLEGKI